jgi:MFS family permease
LCQIATTHKRGATIAPVPDKVMTGGEDATQIVTGATSLPRVSATMWQHVTVSLLWFALSAQWMTVVPIIVPDQVAVILGGDSAAKEAISGTILAVGAVVALIVAPLSGALSDRSRHRRGRRRLFMISGVLGSCVGLLLLLPFGPGANLWLYTAAFVFLQFWWNWVAGAYAGLIPDVMAEHEQGRASAWLNILSVAGTVAGNVVVVATYKTGHPSGTIAIFVILNIAILTVMLRHVHEPQPATQRSAFILREFLCQFYVDPRAHVNFYWVIVTRLLGNMGIWSVFTFLLFYFKDVIRVAEPAQVLPALLGIGAVLAVPASIIGVHLAERHGLVRVTQITSWIMAACALYFALIAFYPSLALIVPAILIYAAAFGAYQAVDWALALKVLPSTEAAGKDMGIWRISMVLPQILGPAVTGGMISAVKVSFGDPTAYATAFGIGAFWLLISAAFVTRVRVPVLRNLWAEPRLLKPCILYSRRRVG